MEEADNPHLLKVVLEVQRVIVELVLLNLRQLQLMLILKIWMWRRIGLMLFCKHLHLTLQGMVETQINTVLKITNLVDQV